MTLPPAADPVLGRGLSRDPDERYQSVAAFHHDLLRSLNASRSALTNGA